MPRDPSSDQSPLYDVRNHAGSIFGEDATSEVMFRGRLFKQRFDAPVGLASGGGRRDRTDDLMLAKHALSQLSYAPVPEDECSTLIEETYLTYEIQRDQSGGPGKT